MIPKTCEMPDLSVLDSRLARSLITAVLSGDPGLSPKEGLYRRNFVRLVDQAIKEDKYVFEFIEQRQAAHFTPNGA